MHDHRCLSFEYMSTVCQRQNMDEEQRKRDGTNNNPSNETFFLLSTSLKSLPIKSAVTVAAAAAANATTVTAHSSSTLEAIRETNNGAVAAAAASQPSSPLPTLLPAPLTPPTLAMNTTNHEISALTTNSIVYTCCYQHHRQLSNCRNSDTDRTTNVANKKLLLSVPLQRKRKKVVYNRDFIGAITPRGSEGIIASDQRFIISHYSCVEKFTKMYTPATVDKDLNEINSCDRRPNRSDRTKMSNDNSVDVDVAAAAPAVTETKSNNNNRTKSNNNLNLNQICSSKLVNPNRNCRRQFSANETGSNCASDQEMDENQANWNNSDKAELNNELANLNITSERRRISNTSPISDEGCLTNISPYSSSGEDDDFVRKFEQRQRLQATAGNHDKVERSASSDSALGLDDDLAIGADVSPTPTVSGQRRMTLTVTDIPLRAALLPVAEPTSLPESPTAIPLPSQSEWNASNPPIVIPSKMILEARIVEIPTPPPPSSDAAATFKLPAGRMSRRESSQSHVSDVAGIEENHPHIRYVRTPSVVVSDYSDDIVCGITLEELEFFRNQRKGSLGANLDFNSSTIDESTDCDDISDMSAASSCSNLNYCGSTISALDDNYTSVSGLQTPERKMSNCSSCSTTSHDDEETFSTSLIDALNNQQHQKKKVCKHNISKANYPKLWYNSPRLLIVSFLLLVFWL